MKSEAHASATHRSQGVGRVLCVDRVNLVLPGNSAGPLPRVLLNFPLPRAMCFPSCSRLSAVYRYCPTHPGWNFVFGRRWWCRVSAANRPPRLSPELGLPSCFAGHVIMVLSTEPACVVYQSVDFLDPWYCAIGTLSMDQHLIHTDSTTVERCPDPDRRHRSHVLHFSGKTQDCSRGNVLYHA